MQDEKAVAFQDINPSALRFQIIYLFIIIELFLVTVECFVFCFEYIYSLHRQLGRFGDPFQNWGCILYLRFWGFQFDEDFKT